MGRMSSCLGEHERRLRESLENEMRELSDRWRLMCISAVKSIEKARARETPLVPRLMWRDNTNFRGMVPRTVLVKYVERRRAERRGIRISKRDRKERGEFSRGR